MSEMFPFCARMYWKNIHELQIYFYAYLVTIAAALIWFKLNRPQYPMNDIGYCGLLKSFSVFLWLHQCLVEWESCDYRTVHGS